MVFEHVQMRIILVGLSLNPLGIVGMTRHDVKKKAYVT